MKKIAINASNLHVGGGVQVASSFLYEIFCSNEFRNKVNVISSSAVHMNTVQILENLTSHKNYEILDTRGFNILNRSFFRKLRCFDTVFTVFGPLYDFKPRYKSVVGFAQAWIIYPKNEVYNDMNVLIRALMRLKYKVQGYFFKKADFIFVELQHVKDGLIKELGIDEKKIYIIHNCISDIYYHKQKWVPISLAKGDFGLKIGFLGRNYIHKNTKIFPQIAKIFSEKYNLCLTFFVTFTEEEWSQTTAEFRSVCYNVGPLTVSECPDFYQRMDAIIFPSLLECFSVTPLEAMAMGKPLFASDRAFNRDVCGTHAFYFDPVSPASAAVAIFDVLVAKKLEKSSLRAARRHARTFSDPKIRVRRYLDLLNEIQETVNSNN